MFQWFSANWGGLQTNNYPFQPKSQNKKCKTRSGTADFVALRKTLRNTRRIIIGSEINTDGRRRRTGDSIIVDSYRSRRRGPTKVPNRVPNKDAHRIRQHGEDRSSGECLLGSADRALAAAFQYWARHHASGADSRFWHPQEGLRAGESGSGQTSSRHLETHRASRRRSYCRQVG